MDGLFSGFAQYAVIAAISSLPLFVAVALITEISLFTGIGRRWLTARIRFALWTLVLVRLMLPLSLETPFGWGNMVRRWYDPDSPRLSQNFDGVLAAEPSPEPESAPLSNLHVATKVAEGLSQNWRDQLATVIAYAMPFLSLMLAAWLATTSFRLSRRIRFANPVKNPAWEELLAEGRQAYGIRVPVRLCVLDDWNAPATLGIVRPTIILPATAESLTSCELQHVLWHELAHVRRCDAAWNCLWIFVRCLQWWNPCFWWAQRAWLSERELACDALAIQLISTSPAEYGRTLLRFLEQMSPSAVSGQIRTPGLVSFLGEKREIMRRLRALSTPLAIETLWGRIVSMTLIALLAVMGLTDSGAKAQPAIPDVVTVPAGTIWQFSSDVTSEAGAADAPRRTHTYDISQALARIRQDHPTATAEGQLLKAIQYCCGLCERKDGLLQVEQDTLAGQASLADHQLSIHATERQHAAVRKLIEQWESFGQRQISVEVRLVTTPREPTSIPGLAAGRIVSPAPLAEHETLPPQEALAFNRNSISGPTFLCVLSPAEVASAQTILQNDRRTNILFAPRVTVFSGSSATIMSGVQRPFLTGLRTAPGTARQPQISIVHEGLQFRAMPLLTDAARIQLNLQWRFSEILDVEVLKARVAGETSESAIQIPHVRELKLEATENLADGTTLVLSPLRRDKQGHFHLCMITPRILPLD